MLWVTRILLAATAVVALALGLTPTSFTPSNGLDAVTCRSVLASVTSGSFAGAGEVPQETVETWLTAVGADDSGTITPELLESAATRADALCADARETRLGGILLTGILGLALAGIASTITRRTPTPRAA